MGIRNKMDMASRVFEKIPSNQCGSNWIANNFVPCIDG